MLPWAGTGLTNMISSWPWPPEPCILRMMVLSFLSWSTRSRASNTVS